MPEKRAVIIAIDGPAASGKGTLARHIAKELGYAYLDSGAVYRLAAKILLERGGGPASRNAALAAAEAVSARLSESALADPALRTHEVSNTASQIAVYAGLREALNRTLRAFAAGARSGGAVMDGRDIGTVVCPDADVKLFVTASTAVRASRRHKELLQSGNTAVTYEAVLRDMRERDARDSNRDVAPLRPAPDAHVIDTSEMDEKAALEAALTLIRNAVASPER